MGRLGVTYEQFGEAANQVLTTGQFPTIEKVRLVLGVGSNTTLNVHMNRWKDEFIRNHLAGTKTTALPDPIQRLITEVWETLRTESTNVSQAIQQEAQLLVKEAQQQKENAEQRAKNLEVLLEKNQLKINHLEADVQLLCNERVEQNQQRAVLEERVQKSAQRFEDLESSTEKHLLELDRSHGETVHHLKNQLAKSTEHFKAEISELKHQSENYRCKMIAEMDGLKVLKEKAEQTLIQATLELKHQVELCKAFGQQNKGLEVDVKVLQQQCYDLEKQRGILEAESSHKEALLAEVKAQREIAQSKLEATREQVGKLKEMKAPLVQ
jgi:hypothetical protein